MILIDLDGKSEREILILLTQAVNGITERLDKINGKCGLHDERIRTVEDWRNKLLGVGILAVVAVPAITALGIKAFG